jgi:2-oxoglutarate dehydrogenase complex dehydrogenase (E1) component-like enzyme
MKVLRLLFTFAHWHGLAKLHMHTDATLQILDVATTDLGEQLRAFQQDTCASFETSELKREAEARKRREAKQGPAVSTVNSSSMTSNQRQRKKFNLQTYKVHTLGDYVSTIKMFGTTDLYTSAIASIFSHVSKSSFDHWQQGELEHRTTKNRYKRTSKKNFVIQLAHIER